MKFRENTDCYSFLLNVVHCLQLIDHDSSFFYALVRVILRIQPNISDSTRAITEH